jgi:hypothetical protein
MKQLINFTILVIVLGVCDLYQIPKLSDTELIRCRTYQILKYQIPNLSDTELSIY